MATTRPSAPNRVGGDSKTVTALIILTTCSIAFLLCVHCRSAAGDLPSDVTRHRQDHDLPTLISATVYSRCAGFTTEQYVQACFSALTLLAAELGQL